MVTKDKDDNNGSKEDIRALVKKTKEKKNQQRNLMNHSKDNRTCQQGNTRTYLEKEDTQIQKRKKNDSAHKGKRNISVRDKGKQDDNKNSKKCKSKDT